MNSTAIEQLPRVAAGLNYLEPSIAKPWALEYQAPPGVPQTTAPELRRPRAVVAHG